MKENMDFIRSNESGASVDKSEKVQGSEIGSERPPAS